MVDLVHARRGKSGSQAIQGSGSVEPEETEQPTLGLQCRASFLHRKPTRAVRRTGGDTQSGAAGSEDEAQWPPTRMGPYFWIQRPEESFSNFVKIDSSRRCAPHECSSPAARDPGDSSVAQISPALGTIPNSWQISSSGFCLQSLPNQLDSLDFSIHRSRWCCQYDSVLLEFNVANQFLIYIILDQRNFNGMGYLVAADRVPAGVGKERLKRLS